ncbi:hypothetical protein N7520_004082 [Penicillium odoratum]|uniref:uncharacterized protein n=1 Tax=Penicillium odoratum TaxID=1167516 RepID=UPI00254699AB|nr:uncharacterized protein N7520_004082 [Penicillium odoratum]KAJ5769523.1 hypothetical protein N7520_004082 [Penicillium odoratum]
MDPPAPQQEEDRVATALYDWAKRQKTFHSDSLARERSIYTISWICALPIEMAAARAVLDEIHESLPTQTDDHNTYLLGSIKAHNVVIACLPTDQYGIVNAASVMTNLRRTFTAIRVGLMVGIGGGVPSKIDIRLGDIVVGTRVMQSDLGKVVGDGELERTAIPKTPHHLLGTAVSALRAKHELEGSKVPSILQQRLERYEYGRPSMPDRLFQATYHHEDPLANCDYCDPKKLVMRSTRTSKDPSIYYGGIASGSQVVKSSISRDKIARNLNVICFEMEAAGLMDILPCLSIRGICDYADSHKSKEWQKYAAATAAAYARELLEELHVTENHAKEAFVPTPDESKSQERRHCLLDSLKFEQIDSRKTNIKAAHAKTCQWVLSHPDYKAWLDPKMLDQHHGFLWINGKPGAGKSTIMKFAYMNTKNRSRNEQSIASFFFNARVLDDPELLPSQNQSTIRSLNVLKEILRKAVALLGRRSFTCFIDALDECDEQQVLDMIQFFEELTEWSTAQKVLLRICFSSRHYPYIIVRWGARLTLEHQPGHEMDLETYIKGQLRAKDSEIVQRILYKASGVFIWVVLVVEILNREYARGAMFLNKRLEEIPSGLSDLFRDILQRDKENMGELLLCFLWIFCAEHPLRPEEFYHALWSGLFSQGLVDGPMPDASVYDTSDGLSRSHIYVISCSKGLAEVTKSGNPTVQFIHESVRDFLVKDGGLYELWPELGLDWQSPSHNRLKNYCHAYIGLTKFGGSGSMLQGSSKSEYKAETLAKYPLLEYVGQNILFHANFAARAIPQDDFLASFDVTSWISISNLFEKFGVRQYTRDASLLYILADKGYPELIRTKLKRDPEINIFGERDKFPIFAALARGDKDSTAALLGLSSIVVDGIDIAEGLNSRKDLGEYKGRTPLSWAILNQRTEIFKALLRSGMDVNKRVDRDGNTLLFLAVAHGNREISELLIQKGAVVHATNKKKQNLLCLAAQEGHRDITALLLDQGLDVNSRLQKKRTALVLAIQNGHQATAELLIDRGADLSILDGSRRTLLHWAAEKGLEAVAKTLIERGLSIDKHDNSKNAAIHLASEQGFEVIVKMLIAAGADINSTDTSGRAPIHLASLRGLAGVVEALIRNRADYNRADSDGKTPIHLASAAGFEAIGRTFTKWTEIRVEGHAKVMEVLIAAGADINSADISGRAPIHLASLRGLAGVVEALIRNRADYDRADSDGKTPIHLASAAGFEAIVRILIKTGADIHKMDRNKRAPIHLASVEGHANVEEILIAAGADINSADISGRAPIHLASEHGFEAVVKLLTAYN